MYGPQPERRGSPLCAFNVEGVHPTDLSTFLDFEGDEQKARLFHSTSLAFSNEFPQFYRIVCSFLRFNE